MIKTGSSLAFCPYKKSHPTPAFVASKAEKEGQAWVVALLLFQRMQKLEKLGKAWGQALHLTFVLFELRRMF